MYIKEWLFTKQENAYKLTLIAELSTRPLYHNSITETDNRHFWIRWEIREMGCTEVSKSDYYEILEALKEREQQIALLVYNQPITEVSND